MKRSFEKFRLRLNEVGLLTSVEQRSLEFHVTLRDLYEGPDRAPSINAARKAVYRWLSKEKSRGVNEIARLFDRMPNGIVKHLRVKKKRVA